MNSPIYYEDISVGQRFTRGGYTIREEEAVGFARDYDPQYYHTDAEAAKASPFGRLIVSGWHTAAITMRLKAESDLGRVSGGLIGMGLDYIKWPRPTYPGDTLSLVITIIEKRESASKPTHGIVRYKAETLNQNGETVQEMVTAVWVPKKQ
jgi:acyl dehydratase